MSFDPTLFFRHQPLITALNNNNAAFAQGAVLKHNNKLYHVQIIQTETEPQALFIRIHTENEIEVRKHVSGERIEYIGADKPTFSDENRAPQIILKGTIVTDQTVQYQGEMTAYEAFENLLKPEGPDPSDPPKPEAPQPPVPKQWTLTQKAIGGGGVVTLLLAASYFAAKKTNLSLPPAVQKRIDLIKEKFEELRKSWSQTAPAA